MTGLPLGEAKKGERMFNTTQNVSLKERIKIYKYKLN